jgi:two-component system cell cycle response regulator CtrA
MTNARKFVTEPTPHEARLPVSDIVVAFARYGIAIQTIARALAKPENQIDAICRRAKAAGDLQMLPPREPQDTRSASLTELVHLRSELSTALEMIREIQASAAEVRLGFTGVAKLTRSEAAMVGILAKRGRVSKMQIYDFAFGERLEQDQPEPKIIDVLICKIRAKLAPHGVEIKTIWGVGYEMTPDNSAKMRKLSADFWGDMPVVDSPSIAPALAEAV